MTQRYYFPEFSVQKSRPNNNNWPIIWTIIAILLFVQWSNGGWPFGQNHRLPDWNETVIDPVDDDPKPQPQPEPSDKPDAKDTYIVRVFETETESNPAWLVKQIQNDQFWLKWLKDQGIALHTRDPMFGDKPNPQAESFVRAAKERGIDPPFWLHASVGGTVLSVTPFSENTSDEEWKAIIQRAVK